MLVALDESNNRILAEPDKKGICPVCETELIPKCGEIKTWHWAHKSLKECDTWSEPEGDWHYSWKQWAGIENTEVVIKKDGKVHRADIRTPGNLIIELQHSPLSTSEVREREEFYGNMIWVIDGDEVCPNLAIDQFVSKDDRLYFRCGQIKKAWVKEITKPCYIHFSRKFYATYFYFNKYRMVCGNLTKELKRAQVEGAPNELKDFLIKIRAGGYCDIIPSKQEFFNKYGSWAHPNNTKRPKPLFTF